MSRPLRLELAGGLYHITSRGDRREDTYLNEADRMRCLGLWGQVCQRFNWRSHAYCLMSNHYHMVVETVDSRLSNGTRQLNGVYTQYFNHAHRRPMVKPLAEHFNVHYSTVSRAIKKAEEGDA